MNEAEDTKRLDWLDANKKGGRFICYVDEWGVKVFSFRHWSKDADPPPYSTREAIDAAMKASDPNGADSVLKP